MSSRLQGNSWHGPKGLQDDLVDDIDTVRIMWCDVMWVCHSINVSPSLLLLSFSLSSLLHNTQHALYTHTFYIRAECTILYLRRTYFTRKCTCPSRQTAVILLIKLSTWYCRNGFFFYPHFAQHPQKKEDKDFDFYGEIMSSLNKIKVIWPVLWWSKQVGIIVVVVCQKIFVILTAGFDS